MHKFSRSDHDWQLHNHPWRWALSLVMRGGYWETRAWQSAGGVGRWTSVNWIKPLSFNWITSKVYHRVELDGHLRGKRIIGAEIPAWSLFLAGPALDTWEFLNPVTGKTTPWRDRLREIGIDPSNGSE